jgi:hypothetical protein
MGDSGPSVWFTCEKNQVTRGLAIAQKPVGWSPLALLSNATNIGTLIA